MCCNYRNQRYFRPQYGYIACAWAGFLGNATAMVLSYIVGQRKYPIDYPLKSIGVYVLIGGLFFAIISYTNANLSVAAALGINTLVISYSLLMSYTMTSRCNNCVNDLVEIRDIMGEEGL